MSPAYAVDDQEVKPNLSGMATDLADLVTVQSQSDTADCLAKDSGYSSRKLWLGVFAMCLIVFCGLVAGAKMGAGLGANLPTITGGIVGIFGIFAGANVAVKAQAAKVANSNPAPVVAPAMTATATVSTGKGKK